MRVEQAVSHSQSNQGVLFKYLFYINILEFIMQFENYKAKINVFKAHACCNLNAAPVEIMCVPFPSYLPNPS